MDLIEKILTGEATREELAKHSELMQENSEYKQNFESYSKIWKNTDVVFSNFERNTAADWKTVAAKTINAGAKVLQLTHKRVVNEYNEVGSSCNYFNCRNICNIAVCKAAKCCHSVQFG